jgi:pimeloyl-ACP methyl ester carboxylesterase
MHMEQQVRIRTPDKHAIYGTLNAAQGKQDRLIIFVHGLTGHQNEHIFYNAARFFPMHGYATFRFDLYSCDDKGRRFSDASLTTHAADLETVVKHYARRYKRIYAVGHSLGGPTILLAHHDGIDGIVLWDPSAEQTKKFMPQWCQYDPRIGQYMMHWATDIIMSKRMHDELESMQCMPTLAAQAQVPTYVILAGKSVLKRDWKSTKEKVIIPSASHGFDEEGAEEQLFKHTLAFLRKH